MLTSLVIKLKAPSSAELPATLGRAAQALFLRLLGQHDAALAKAIHTGAGLKPYTVSNILMGRRKAGTLYVEAGQEGWLRFTGLTAEISQHMQALAAEPPATVELDNQPFEVMGATLDPAEHGWAGQVSYAQLAAPFLLGGSGSPSRRIRLDFASPTTFRSKGRTLPLPLPELVFGSLLDKWLTFAPIALPAEVRQLAAEEIVVTRYQLRTRGFPYKPGVMQIGFTGPVMFVVLKNDPYWLNVLHMLAHFALFSGIGYQTGVGLGQVRVIDKPAE